MANGEKQKKERHKIQDTHIIVYQHVGLAQELI